MDDSIKPDGTREELELVKVNINSLHTPGVPDPVAQAGKLFPRPKPLYLGRRREKELKMEFKRVKKGLIKKEKDKKPTSYIVVYPYSKAGEYKVSTRLGQAEMKLIKEEAISIIERKVNGNTTNI